jgi:beta-lactam-binding protein with PASTA domain
MALKLVGTGLAGLVAAVLTACGGTSSSASPTTNTASATTTHAQAAPVVVPRLVGKHYRLAVRDLHQRGLTAHAPGFTGSYSSTAMNGCETILNQAPSPGAKVAPRSAVAIVIGLARC